MNCELFSRVLQHCSEHMSCSVQNPTALFMDNHQSYFSVKVIEMGGERLSIITFPPHTSQNLQQLHAAVYGPLKCHYQKSSG